MKKLDSIAVALVLAIAVFIVPDFAQAQEYIIDNGDSAGAVYTDSSGTWLVSSGTNPYGANSLYSNEDGAWYSWRIGGLPLGTYDVYLWWTSYSNRCTDVEVGVYAGLGAGAGAYVNQQQNGGQWNYIGTCDFLDYEGIVYVTSDGGCTVSADAVKFSEPGSIEPVPICDNGQSCSYSYGTWSPSSGANYYGTQSEYTTQNGAYYLYTMPVASPGNYELSMRWTYYSNRCSSVEVVILDEYGNFLDMQYVNQLENGGQWNPLGVYDLNGGANVLINSYGGCTVSADAVQLSASGPVICEADGYEYDNSPAGHPIDPGDVETHTIHEDGDVDWVYISPTEGNTYTVETSNLSGSNPDTVVYVYEWPSLTLVASNDDGGDGLASRVTWVASSAAEYYDIKIVAYGGGGGGYDDQGGGDACCHYDLTVEEEEPAPPQSEYIIDNGDSGTSFSGSWPVSSGANPYGSNSLYNSSPGDWYQWEKSGLAGTYDVSLWWTYYSNRCAVVEVVIYDGTSWHTEYVNQLQNGGQWNKIGTYDFNGYGYVYVFGYGGCTVSADAVKFSEPGSIEPEGSICDNGQSQSCSTAYGTWSPSSGANYYGTQSEYSTSYNAYYNYILPVASPGNYELSLRWTYYSNRCSSVAVYVLDDLWNVIGMHAVNQLEDGGQWNPLGSYDLETGAHVQIQSSGAGGCTTCADAVRLMPN